MLKVPRYLGSLCHAASGRTVEFPNGLIIGARSEEVRELAGCDVQQSLVPLRW
jgi:hypothetical protein